MLEVITIVGMFAILTFKFVCTLTKNALEITNQTCLELKKYRFKHMKTSEQVSVG